MSSTAIDLAKKLRAYEEEHPFQAAAAGFNPVYGAASGAAAIADPDAAWWEKVLGGVGGVPGLGGASKATVLLASRLRKYPNLLKKAAKFIDPYTGRKMAELDDSLSHVDKEMLDQLELNKMNGSLEDVYQHPDLYQAEPTLGYTSVAKMTPDPDVTAVGQYAPGGQYPGQVRYRELPDPSSARSIDNFDNTIRHETQHAVDDIGGLLNDTDVPDYWRRLSEIRARLTAQRWNYSPEGREAYPFDKHMIDELRRLDVRESANRKMGEATAEEINYYLKKRNLKLEDLIR